MRIIGKPSVTPVGPLSLERNTNACWFHRGPERSASLGVGPGLRPEEGRRRLPQCLPHEQLLHSICVVQDNWLQESCKSAAQRHLQESDPASSRAAAQIRASRASRCLCLGCKPLSKRHGTHDCRANSAGSIMGRSVVGVEQVTQLVFPSTRIKG